MNNSDDECENKTNNYEVYRNDIKYKKHRNIDPSKAIWDKDVKSDYLDKDTDSLEYRLEECKRENYETLDLSNMDSDCFDNLLKHETYEKIKKSVNHIFANGSNLREIPDLDDYPKLITLDISDNDLIELPKLPKKIEELIINDNKIISSITDLPNLKRLEMRNNKINKIIKCDNLERLDAFNNPIVILDKMKNLYYLDISRTKLKDINTYPKLTFLDCSYTDIKKIPKMEKLEELICNDSQVNDVMDINVEYLRIVNSKIDIIPYMDKLTRISHNNVSDLKVSKKYKISRIIKNKGNTFDILIDK